MTENIRNDILQTYLELLAELTPDKITVLKLIKAVPVSRSYFYSLYSGLGELYAQAVDSAIAVINQVLDFKDFDPTDIANVQARVELNVKVYQQHRLLFYVLLVKQPDQQLIDAIKARLIAFESQWDDFDFSNEIVIAGLIASIRSDLSRWYEKNEPEQAPDSISAYIVDRITQMTESH